MFQKNKAYNNKYFKDVVIYVNGVLPSEDTHKLAITWLNNRYFYVIKQDEIEIKQEDVKNWSEI